MDVKRHLLKIACSLGVCATAFLISVSVASESTQPTPPAKEAKPQPANTAPLPSPVILPTSPLKNILPAPTTAAPSTLTSELLNMRATEPRPLATTPHEQAHIWNLQNADIHSVIDEVARETGKNFLVDPRVNGKVSLVATKPLPPTELYQVFLSILSAYGFAAVPDGNVIKILPNIDAAQVGGPVATEKNPGEGNDLLVRVVPVNFVSSTQLVPVLRPMLPQWANIAAYSPTNSLIITGNANAIDRIVQIVAQIDTQSDNGGNVVKLHHASAKQVVTILKNLQTSIESYGGPTDQVSIVADPRTNSVIISGNDMQRLRTRILISQLDTPAQEGDGNTQVVFLHYLNAKKIAPILDKVAKGGGSATNPAPGNTTSEAPTTHAATGNTNGADGSDSEEEDNISGLTAVLPEEGTNALIITASNAMTASLKNIIQELDVRPAEVYVQAVIVELDASSMEQLGIQWGSFNAATLQQGTGDGSSPNAAFQGGAGVAIVQNGRFQELIAAIKGMSGANILSQPTIMVLDNKKATFSVGQQISVQTQSMTNGESNGNTGLPVISSNFQQQDVGLKLVVQPQVDQDNTVQLDIDQSNGSLQNPDNPGTTPVINQSEIKTSVIINSGDILILGGLMSNSFTQSTYRTPILSDIPLLGKIFTYHQTELTKKNLMVFMRPIIVHSPLVGSQITNKQYAYIRDLQREWNSENAGKDNTVDRLLPPRGGDVTLPVPFTD